MFCGFTWCRRTLSSQSPGCVFTRLWPALESALCVPGVGEGFFPSLTALNPCRAARFLFESSFRLPCILVVGGVGWLQAGILSFLRFFPLLKKCASDCQSWRLPGGHFPLSLFFFPVVQCVVVGGLWVLMQFCGCRLLGVGCPVGRLSRVAASFR